jgi:trans-aconitate methyltransferase
VSPPTPRAEPLQPLPSFAANSSNDARIELAYEPLEPLYVPAPVQRVAFIVERCVRRRVLDLGCYDETALSKRGTGHWLHERIAAVATSLLGVDNSPQLPAEGVSTGPRARIVRADVQDFAAIRTAVERYGDVEVIVAGELIEHLPNSLAFLRALRQHFPNKELVATTPNATALSNGLLALARRENCHIDHLQVYSYKTLTTLCRNAGIASYRIIPYHQYYTEMILRERGLRRFGVRAAETLVNIAESAFPLLSGGLILHVPAL